MDLNKIFIHLPIIEEIMYTQLPTNSSILNISDVINLQVRTRSIITSMSNIEDETGILKNIKASADSLEIIFSKALRSHIDNDNENINENLESAKKKINCIINDLEEAQKKITVDNPLSEALGLAKSIYKDLNKRKPTPTPTPVPAPSLARTPASAPVPIVDTPSATKVVLGAFLGSAVSGIGLSGLGIGVGAIVGAVSSSTAAVLTTLATASTGLAGALLTTAGVHGAMGFFAGLGVVGGAAVATGGLIIAAAVAVAVVAGLGYLAYKCHKSWKNNS